MPWTIEGGATHGSAIDALQEVGMVNVKCVLV